MSAPKLNLYLLLKASRRKTFSNFFSQPEGKISEEVQRQLRSLCFSKILLILIYSLLIQTVFPFPVLRETQTTSTVQPNTTEPIGETPDPLYKQTEETVVIYGKKILERNDFQTRFVDRFKIPDDVVAPFSIRIENGVNGNDKVFDGSILINGRPVIAPGTLNLQASIITQPIELFSSNKLEVSFLSRGKASIALTIFGTRRIPTLNQPVITGISPDRGLIGSTVTITGSNLIPRFSTDNDTLAVSFAGQNGTRRLASIISKSLTQVRVTVPNGVATGFIELSHELGRAISPTQFTAQTNLDFQLTGQPATVSAIQRASGIQVVAVSSSNPQFTQLVRLAASGLPNGVTAKFEPEQITAGATSSLTLNLSKVELAAGSYPFTITGSATVDGQQLTRTFSSTLNVIAAGKTTLSGRVLSIDKEPVVGATVFLDGQSSVSNAAGVFILSNVTAGNNRPVQVDGRTAISPGRTYPVISEPANIVAGQPNVVPFIFYLPPIDVQYEVPVVPNQNTTATNPRVRDLRMTVPAGANLRNRDGSPVARVSVTPLEIDRTPSPLPPNVDAQVVYTAQPGGALTNIEVPVTFPNLGGEAPGTRLDLYAFDHDNVNWYIYGSGRVSTDGRTVVPDINPNTGRQYGLRNFSWFFISRPPPPLPPRLGDPSPQGQGGNPPDDDCPEPGGTPGGNGLPAPGITGVGSTTNNPVDLSTGMKIEETTDIAFGGSRGDLRLTRIYTTDLQRDCINCPFGRGTTHNYDIKLSGTFLSGGTGQVLMAGEMDGRLFSYQRTDPDGALVFTTTATPSQLGDIVRKLTDETYEYRYIYGGMLKFDTNQRLTQIIDRKGNAVSLSYTGANLTAVTDAVGRSINFQYDSSNRIFLVTDPLNRVWSYSYENGVSLARVTDPNGYSMTYTYNNSRLASVTDSNGNLMKQITYDDRSRVTEEKYADDGIEKYNYTLSGTNVTEATVTDQLDRTRTLRFNASGQIIEETDGLGQTVKIKRNITTNLPEEITGSCGCTEELREYNDRGNIISTTDRLGNRTRYEYEPVFNQISRKIDKLNHVTEYSYDTQGNLSSVLNALNQRTNFTYDSFGQLKTVTDPLNHTTTLDYDNNGNVIGVTDALNHRTAFEYDAIGRQTAIVDALLRRTEFTYDPIDRVKTVKDPNNQTTRFQYDANGNLISQTNALNQTTTFIYDNKDRRTSVRDALGNTSNFVYNESDEMISATSPLGRTINYNYDARGQVKQITDALGNTTKFDYDNKGNLTALTDERNFNSTFFYDELSRLTGKRDPVGKLTAYTYDAEGNLTEKVDREDRRALMTYDGLNRLTRAVYPDAAVDYTYDEAGRLARINDTQDGATIRSFDEANRLMSEQTTAGLLSYTYNNADQRSSMTADNRLPVNYGYDNAGRLQTISQGQEIFTYSYDELSRIASLMRPNGVKTSMAYDAAGRLARILHTNSANQGIEDFVYAYNPDSEIQSIKSIAAAQLLANSATVGAADPANRIRQFGDANLQFNNEGQTTAKNNSQGSNSYEWDSRGRLTRVVPPTGQAISYTYDSSSRRMSSTVGGVTTRYLNDGSDVVLDKANNGGTIDYLNGIGIDDKLRQSSIAAGNQYFLQDQIGSTVALTNISGGLTERLRYDAFGDSTGSSITRYDYTGRERDSISGLMFYRERWYDSKQGRFISEDPIGFESENSFYTYVSNTPVNANDPDGSFLNLVIGGAISVAIGYALAKLTHSCYTAGDFAIDFASGAVGAGIVSKLTKLKRINEFRKIAKAEGLLKVQKSTRFVEEYAGGGKRVVINYKASSRPGALPRSQYPRGKYNTGNGKYLDPFTGNYGNKSSLQAHVPLEPKMLGRSAGVGIGTGIMVTPTNMNPCECK